MHICTIIARHSLAQARVLARSYADCHAGQRCSVLVLDDPEQMLADGSEPFEVIRPEQLPLEGFEAMAAIYPLADLAAAIKPLLLCHLLDRDREPIAYVDADVRFYERIDGIRQLLTGETVVLVPRLLHELRSATEGGRSESAAVTQGGYDLGFVALAPGPAAARLLSWWSARNGIGDSPADRAIAIFDQRRFEGVGSVTSIQSTVDPGLAVALWNLHERTLVHVGNNYTAGGEPLRFFHFSGLDPSRPFTLADDQRRVRLAADPALAQLCDEYVAELRAQGLDRARALPWRYDRLPDGTVLNPILRSLYAEGARTGAFRFSPFTEAGTEELIAWCHEPADVGAEHGLTRLSQEIYRNRPDLREIFPDPGGADGHRLLDWTVRHGLAENGLTPRWFPGAGDQAQVPDDEGGVCGVNVAGYLRSELGIGEVARSVISALDAREVPLLPIHGSLVPGAPRAHGLAFLDTAAATFPVNLICVNADHLAHFLTDAGSRFSDDRYNVGFWWWEVPSFPDESRKSFDLIDEVWVGSEYVADALQPVSPVPVITIPTPVTRPPVLHLPRSELGLPDGFLFLFMFDFHSVFSRKNPLALIDAFRSAFQPGAGASLVIKCINQASDPDNYDRLHRSALEHRDIHIIARYDSVDRKNAMLAACDCYVSLHRAEGFGLSLAEAMSLGKPVIATGYSGNLDFMSETNSYLVEYGLERVGEGNYPYPANGEWAAPDHEHAARLMREVFEAPLEARRRGRQGALDIMSTHSPDAAGGVMERRLRAIARHLKEGRSLRHVGASTTTGGLEGLVAPHPVDPKVSPPATGGFVRRLAGRAALRAIDPLLRHQAEMAERAYLVDASLSRLIDAQALELQRLGHRSGIQAARLLAELRRQEAELALIRHQVAALRSSSAEP